MKQLRILILVLLAVVLPIRGALAAALTCPEGTGQPATTAGAGHAHHDLHADHDRHGHDATSHREAHDAATSDDTTGAGHSGTCKFCVSGCCVTPLASAPPAMPSPLLADSVAFPALSAPVPAFQSEGQERPPRTI